MSIVKMILNKSLDEAKIAIRGGLFSRAKYVVEQSFNDADVVNNARSVMEMRDTPDNSTLPLTRRQVERLLNTYERRDEDSADNKEERSIEGIKKARWYPPEVKSDFVSDVTDHKNTNDRPAKLMPYDYYYTVDKPGSINTEPAGEIGDADTDVDTNAGNWGGTENSFFKESVDEHGIEQSASIDDIESTIHDSIRNAKPVELHLADGNYVHLSPHDATHLMKVHGASGIVNSMDSIHTFHGLVKSAYGKTVPAAEHEVHV